MTLFDPIVWDTLQALLGIHENEWLDPERVTIRARFLDAPGQKIKMNITIIICVFFVYFGWNPFNSPCAFLIFFPFSTMTTPWLSGGITALPALPGTVAAAIPCDPGQRGGHGGSDSMLGAGCVLTGIILVNYSDLTRGRPKWWFSKGL